MAFSLVAAAMLPISALSSAQACSVEQYNAFRAAAEASNGCGGLLTKYDQHLVNEANAITRTGLPFKPQCIDNEDEDCQGHPIQDPPILCPCLNVMKPGEYLNCGLVGSDLSNSMYVQRATCAVIGKRSRADWIAHQMSCTTARIELSGVSITGETGVAGCEYSCLASFGCEYFSHRTWKNASGMLQEECYQESTECADESNQIKGTGNLFRLFAFDGISRYVWSAQPNGGRILKDILLVDKTTVTCSSSDVKVTSVHTPFHKSL